MDEILARLRVTEAQIAAVCRRWKIERLDLFGSVRREDFDAASDVDVLVTFADGGQGRLHDLIDMEEELKVLFGRNVDLVKPRLIEESRTWIRRRNILSSAQLVYAAA